MFHPFISRQMNKQFRNHDMQPLSADVIDYADSVIRGLHIALYNQVEPVYRRPEHPVDGWGLTATPLKKEVQFLGIPTVTILGHRSIYLSRFPYVIQRVLTAPNPYRAYEEKVIKVDRTSVPALLGEDPTLYYNLLDSVDDSIREFDLDYTVE